MKRFLLALLTSLTLAPAYAQELKVCTEIDDFPPFNYRTGNPRKQLIANTTGSSVELLAGVGKTLGFTVRLQRLPWTRCLLAVESGQSDIGLDAYRDAERARRFDFSTPYFQLTPQIFYYRPSFPRGLPAIRLTGLQHLAGCGIHGYSYSHYGAGSSNLELKADTHAQLIEKLKAGRCDYFVEEMEVMRGFALTEKDFLADPMLASAAVPDATPPQLHLILSRKSKTAQTLKDAINLEISKSVTSGKVVQLVRQHLQQ